MRFAVVVAMIGGAASPQSLLAQSPDLPAVVFVCEHGTAKSVIALAYFQKLARERGLPLRAISRGTAPDAALPPFMVIGLRNDGFGSLVERFTPTRVDARALSGAMLVVTFDLPELPGNNGRVERWDKLPTAGLDYARASVAIEARVRRLVDSLAQGRAIPPVDANR